MKLRIDGDYEVRIKPEEPKHPKPCFQQHLTAFTFDWYGWLEAGEYIDTVRLDYDRKLKRVSATDVGQAHITVWIGGELEKINGQIRCRVVTSKLRHADRIMKIVKGSGK